MRFRPAQHLTRQNDIRAVREQGRRVDCRAFTLWWKRRALAATSPTTSTLAPATAAPIATISASETPRVCVIASTAAVGGAVQRNRAKRRLREVFRHQQQLVPAGCDLLLIARSAVTTWDMNELQKRFSDACNQIQRG
jgi:ribonuclease P protein component